MTYPTHKQYAVSLAFIAAIVLYKLNMFSIQYFVYLPIIILTSKYGGVFPDIDHSWQNVKEKTIPNWILNKLIHLTGGRHRSWQTHSIDIVAVFTLLCLVLPNILVEYNKIDKFNCEIIQIILIGFCSGWISHIVADMTTSAGVRLFCWCKKITIKIVPKSIGKLRFNTGNEWEEFVFKCVKTINIVLGAICVLFPIIDMYGYQVVGYIEQVI